MDVLGSELGVVEGPVVCQDGALLVTSVNQGRVFRIADGRVKTFAATGGGPNGAAEGPDGTIYIAQNGGVRPALNEIRSDAGIQTITSNGEVEIFGLCMRSPNDLCFGPDGFLYVTDPKRPGWNEGRIWRCSIKNGLCVEILSCDWYPNGIGFSLNDDWIYVADSKNRRIVRIPIASPGANTVETLFELDHGIPGGFAFDAEGRLVVACPNFEPECGDVQVYADGKLIEVIRPGISQLYTNVAISQDCRIYICDADSGNVLAGHWPCPGLALHPFRNMRSHPSAAMPSTGGTTRDDDDPNT